MQSSEKKANKSGVGKPSLAVSAKKSIRAFLEKGGASERFENINKNEDEEAEAESPVGDLSYTVQKLRQNYRHTAFRFKNRDDHIFIALSLVVSFNNILRFPIICSESGGVLFLIPYVLCLTFITTPIIYLENALGQYSSLPPMQLFYHLCPAFGGIGFAMSLVAIFKSLLLSYSALDMFYTLKSMSAAFSSWSRTSWLECIYEGHSSCFDPYVKCNEAAGSYQYYSECYDLSLWNSAMHPNYTWEQVVVGVTSTSEALRELPSSIYLWEKIRKPGSPSAFFLASATIEQAIIAVIAMLGMRIYAKVARFIVIFPLFCLLGCMIFAFLKAGFHDSFAAIAEGFSPDLREFLSFRAWTVAVLHSVVATNLLDGSFITLAAMKDFRNNFMRDTVVVVVYGMMTNIFACFVLYSVCGAAAKLIFPLHSGDRLKILWKHGEQAHFIIMPLLFAKTTFGAILLSLTYFSIFLFTIGAQILALEMIIMTVYRTAARTKFVDTTTSRNIIVCLYFLLMYLYAYIYGRTPEKTVLGVQLHLNNIRKLKTQTIRDARMRYFYFAFVLSILAFFEVVISIHIYRLKRFVVNLRTMLGTPPSDLWRILGYPVNWYWTACWYAITPALCVGAGIAALFAAISTSLYSGMSASTAVITLFPLSAIFVVMIIHMIRAHRAGTALKSLFVADLRWAPELGGDRQQALYEERATRAFI